MRLAYLDCATGISGDMTLAALVDAGVDPAAIRAGVASLGVPGVDLQFDTVRRCGFRALHLKVRHTEQHAHRNLSDICRLIDGAGKITGAQKQLARDIFTAIGVAEAKVHHTSLEQIHFHEVGAIDSIVDIVGAAIGFDLLRADQIVCSPLPTGRGKVQIAHGVCSVPAPATAELLTGIPLADVPVDAELTTPTGAAIAKTVVDHFGSLPAMTVERIGYGAGTRDLADRPNTLRLIIGTIAESPESDVVLVLETNLDDVSPEIVGYTRQKLLAAGALDVFSIPIQMKKDRPGTLLSVICRPIDRDMLEKIIFSETPTFGIRRRLMERSKRARRECVVETPWGPIRGKLGTRSGGPPLFTPEFDDCARVAAEQQVPLHDVYRAATAAYESNPQAITPTPAAAEPDPPRTHDHDLSHDHHHDHDHGHDHGHDHH